MNPGLLCRSLTSVAVLFTLASAAEAAPAISGCAVFPADNVWNTPIDTLPVDANSDAYITTIGSTRGLHPDFGTVFDGAPIGIPFVVVDRNTPRSSVTFEFADESDAGPYPIPANPPIEGGPQSTGDRHILMLDKDACKLYELYAANNATGVWQAGSGAIWDLKSHALRPDTWTSADAAGLPILPGLVRYEEVAAGELQHAIRFTAVQTRRAYVWPARHFASSRTGLQYPPLGQRFRLKASFNIATFSPQVQVILRAMKKYGLILADNGSNWYLSGVPDSRWNDDVLVGELGRVKGSDFEAVDSTSLVINANSGQARQAACLNGNDDADGDGVPCLVEVAEGLNPAVKDNNIFAETAAGRRLFVMQQFRDFLSREGDAAGIGFWVDEITAGRQSRVSMAEAFFNSVEFQQRVAPIARLYFATYLRIPDTAGLLYWIGQFQSGQSLTAIASVFAASSEFATRYGNLSNRDFVNQIYMNVLGRPADSAGSDFWTAQLAAGQSRGAMLSQFSESVEYRAASSNAIYVTAMYIAFLRRAPDAAGYAFWKPQLDGGRSGRDLIIQFVGSSEYRTRFLP